MSYILPIAAMIATAITTMTAVVFCMGMGANSSPRQIRILKLWMSGLSLLGIAGIGLGIFFLQQDQPTLAAWTAFAPTVVTAAVFAVALLK